MESLQIRDLRIGNWVKWNYEERSDGNAYPVEFGYELDDIKNNPNIVKPIPLTEEWLKRFGFNDDGFKQYEFINWGIKVKKDPHAISETNWIVFHGFMNQFSELVSLKHVHQLQNLYFALTGEELELKL